MERFRPGYYSQHICDRDQQLLSTMIPFLFWSTAEFINWMICVQEGTFTTEQRIRTSSLHFFDHILAHLRQSGRFDPEIQQPKCGSCGSVYILFSLQHCHGSAQAQCLLLSLRHRPEIDGAHLKGCVVIEIVRNRRFLYHYYRRLE